MAADLAVRVLDRDVGGGHLQFTGRADGEDAGLLAQACFQGLDDGEVTLADQFALLLNSNPLL